jgi:hypothetical protein
MAADGVQEHHRKVAVQWSAALMMHRLPCGNSKNVGTDADVAT